MTCDLYIEKYLSNLHPLQIENIKEELYNKPNDYICPDIDMIYLSGQQANKGQKFKYTLGLSEELQE